jgi:hypothetical protein
MRRLLTILFVLVLIVGAIAAFLVFTTSKNATPVRFPLSDSQLGLLMRVSASADSFALIPTAPHLHAKLKTNPVTRDAVDQWTAEQHLPPAWLLGSADVVVWKHQKKTSYAFRTDPLRAFLVRGWLMVSANVDARWDGRAFLINAPHERSLTRSELEPMLRLAAGLPEGDVFVVQNASSRGAFPPLSRPAVTSLRVTSSEIVLVSRARTAPTEQTVAAKPIDARLPAGALLAVAFASPPKILDDMRRLLRADIATLVTDGGSIALYDIDAGTLLPRPEGVIVVPATDARRAAMTDVARIAELVGETRDTGTELLVSFDRHSVGQYLKDTKAPATWPANRWALRLDPQRLVPILGRLGDSAGLRLAAPRIYRAARDLRRWIQYLEAAEVIEAADSANAGVEELRVRIASK